MWIFCKWTSHNCIWSRKLVSPTLGESFKVPEELVIWPYETESHALNCFPLYTNMAFQTCGLPMCKVTIYFLLSLFAVGEGQYKGFRRFHQVQDTQQRAVFEEQWFTQKLDHFNGADSREWKQVSLSMFILSRVETDFEKLSKGSD